MNKTPELSYTVIVRALQRNGWSIVRQKGSHIRLHKHNGDELLKLTVPAHKPVKRSTLSHIIKQARLTPNEFEKLLK
ncbi:type II toxin-antitoxin system HicA family toxin [Candidatus Latescibacterota bacterium]